MEANKNAINRDILSSRKEFFERLMNNRYFYSIGNEIHNGPAGLYDWGPIGCAIRNNV